jgi:hypothetical protein
MERGGPRALPLAFLNNYPGSIVDLYFELLDKFQSNPTRMMSSLFGKSKSKNKRLKSKAKKLGVRLTVKRNGKRVYKSKKVLEKQIKNAKRRSYLK